ncbi:hypothetical protein [Stieleria varia]|uniref:hypothetical protein n=1 Tax=Stieleria varia TaxID=2528005 RepID=UPI0018D25AD8|nr:hypothetical protein [Stieleria varia]
MLRCSRAAEAWTPTRGGFSLIEIVVGLVLMGSVLVGSLLALSRHRRQMALAEDRIVAAMAADELLLQLTSQRDGIPLDGRGVIGGQPGWIWETRVVGLAQPLGVPVRVVRLTIFSTEGISLRNLVSVDVVKSVQDGVGGFAVAGVGR